IDGIETPVGCRVAPDISPPATGILSVRPEGASVHPAASRDGQVYGQVSGRICAATYLGHLFQLQIRLDFGPTIEVLEMNAAAWNVGDAVSVAFDPERCFFISQPAPSRPAHP